MKKSILVILLALTSGSLQLKAGEVLDYNPTQILLNNVEIKRISHENKTLVHPNAHFSIYENQDPTSSDQRIDSQHKRKRLRWNEVPVEEVGQSIERYATINPESKFAYSLKIDRNNGLHIKSITEVEVTKKDSASLKQVKAQVAQFNRENNELDSLTFCKGQLRPSEIYGDKARVLVKNQNTKQLYLNCQSLTPRICHFVNKNKEKLRHEKHLSVSERSVASKIKQDVEDNYSYRFLQSKNLELLKRAVPPGGKYYAVGWPNDDLLIHFESVDNRSEVDDNYLTWLTENCDKHAAMFAQEIPFEVEAEMRGFEYRIKLKGLRNQLNPSFVSGPSGNTSK